MAKTKKISKKDKIILISSILGIIVILLGIAFYFVMYTKLFQDKSIGEVSITSEVKTPETVKEKSVNFLVVGIGDDESERASTNLTDTIMVVNLDFENKKISGLQIPRDTYVGDLAALGKINSVFNQSPEYYTHTGMQGLIDIVHKTFKINIDHYVAIKMDGFKNLVDAVGGVTMDVPADMELNGTYVSAGKQTLDGKQAIAVVRTRNVYATQDIGRLDTQKIFISALVDKMFTLGPVEMVKLVPTIFSTLSTDLTLNDMLKYYNSVSGFDLSNMVMMTVPGVPDNVDGYSVYCVYPERTTALINKYFNAHSTPITPDMLELQSDVYELEITEDELQDIKNLDDIKNGQETEVPYLENNTNSTSESTSSSADESVSNE